MQQVLLSITLIVTITFASDAQSSRLLKAPGGYANETLLKMSYAIGFLDLIEIKPEVPASLDVYKNVVYKNLDTGDLKLDIYNRKDLNSAAPALIFIHGGAWEKGNRSDYLPYLVDYAKKGYVTITISYRLSDEAKFPAQILDVKSAIEWVRINANQYHINPNKMAVIGGSAGGHLAMLLGYSDETYFTEECISPMQQKVQAIVNFYGPANLTTEYARNRDETFGLLGKSYTEAPDMYKSASPATYITADDTPTLIFHGTIDSLVPVSQSDNLHKQLDEAGVENEYHRLKGWPHTMDIEEKVNNYCRFYMDDFFDKYLMH